MSGKKKIFTGSLIAVAIIAVFSSVVYSRQKPKEVLEPPQTISLEKQNLQNVISVTGTLESAEKRIITSELTGQKALKIHVKAGDAVKEGDIIASLDPAPIEDKLKVLRESVNTFYQKTAIEKELAARNLEATVETSSIEKARIQDAINSANNTLEKTKEESAQAKALLEQEKSSLSGRENTLHNARKERENAGQHMKDTMSRLTDAKALFELKQGEKPPLEETASQKETELKEANSAYESAKAIFEGIAPDESQTPEAIEAAREEMENQKTRLESVQAEYDTIGSQLSALNNELTALSESVVNLENAYKQAEADYQQKSEAADSSETALSASKEAAAAKESAYKQSDAAVAAAANDYKKTLQSDEDITRNSEKSIADLQDNLKGIHITEAGSNLQEKMDIKKYERQLEDCIIKAPIGGIITSLGIQEGDAYKGGEIATIQNTGKLVVAASIDQFDIAKIRNGMSSEIQAVSAEDEKIKGKVSFISPIPKSQPVTAGTNENSSSSTDYPIEITIPASNHLLRLGMKAKTNIIVAEAKNVYAVPYNCIITDEQGNSIIEVLENDISRIIKIEKGLETDYFVEIKSKELKKGMKVIVPLEAASQTTTE